MDMEQPVVLLSDNGDSLETHFAGFVRAMQMFRLQGVPLVKFAGEIRTFVNEDGAAVSRFIFRASGKDFIALRNAIQRNAAYTAGMKTRP